MAREFPIANGKLVTDLDANGHKILNTQGEGGGSGGTPDYNDLDNKPKINDVEVSGGKSAEDYGLATKEQLSAVNKTATDALGIADLARGDIGKVYNLAYQNSEQIKNKRDKADNIAAASGFGEWSLTCPNVELNSALAKGGYSVRFSDDTWYVYDAPVPSTGDYGIVDTLVQGSHDDVLLIFDKFFIDRSTGIEYPVTATRSISTKAGEPYVTPTGVKSIAIPKYELVDATIADGVVTVAPYSITEVTVDDSMSELTFVFPEKTKGQSRDFFVRLVVTGETPPTLSFVEPNGDAVSFDVDDDSWADIEQGVNILMFTDTAE
jgi:hypothetical protein